MAKKRPYKPYRSALKSLSHVTSVKLLEDHEALTIGGRRKKAGLDLCFRLVTWNIFKGHGGKVFEQELRQILARTDLVLAQEALMHEGIAHLFNKKGFSWIHCASYRRRDGISDGVISLCRAHAQEAIRITSLATEPVFKTPKVALVTFYPFKDGNSLMVVNLHKILVRTLAQAKREMLNILEHLPAHTGPTIMAGDFNTFTQKYQDRMTETLRTHGFSEAAPKQVKKSLINRLDHVYVRGLEVSGVHIDTAYESSDHLPIFVDLKFNRGNQL